MQKNGLEGNIIKHAKNWERVSSIEFICTAVRNFTNHHPASSSNHKLNETVVNDKVETVGDVTMNIETDMDKITEAIKLHEIHDSPVRYSKRLHVIFSLYTYQIQIGF